jgi:disulfide bond formation protein DsbB
MLVATLALALGTRFGALASAIVGTLGFGLEWITGITERLGVQYGNDGLVNATTAIGLILPSDSYWRATQWAVQPTVITAAFNTREAYSKAGPLAGALPPTVAMMMWTALWFLAVLILAMRGFARRDL